MALEPKFEFIDDLNPNDPDSSPDTLAQADNHLRGIKSSTKGSFPNLGQASVSGTAEELNELTTELGGGVDVALLAKIYPVGSIYISTTSSNPSALFGGTWAALGDKQTLVQQGTYAAGSTGGSSTAVNVTHSHGPGTLSTDSQGAHTHTVDIVNTSGSGVSGLDAGSLSGTKATGSSGTHNHSVTGGNTDASGVSGANANMPPYLSVYMWKRTA